MDSESFRDAQSRFLERHRLVAESRCVPVACIDGQAHVLIAGDGPPVVLLNGIGTPAAMWAPLMTRLHGLALHGIDLPGYGLTDVPTGPPIDIRQFAVQYLEQTLDALGLDSAAFITNSLGALWASWLALARPQRVTRLVAIGCPALALGTSAPLPMRLLATPLGRLMTRLQPPSPAQVEQLARMVGQHPMEEDLVDLLVETERLPGGREMLLDTLRALIRLRGARPERVLSEAQIAEITAPTQLIWGADDPFGNVAVGQRMAAIMPDAEFHVIDGGHAPWLTDPDRAAALVNAFLGPA